MKDSGLPSSDARSSITYSIGVTGVDYKSSTGERGGAGRVVLRSSSWLPFFPLGWVRRKVT